MSLTGDFETYLADDWYGRPMTVEALLECEAEAGFETAVVMPAAKPDADNDGLLEKTAGNPRLLPCVMMDPHRGAEGLDALSGYAERGARGMKLMGAIHKFNVDDESVFPFAERARDLGLVISIHSGREACHPDRIGRVAAHVPEAPVIIDHMGYPDNFEEALRVCADCPNTYMGTTILRFHKQWADNPEQAVPEGVRTAVEQLGPERVVFGSNLPEYRPIQVKRAIERLDLGEAAEALIFGGNLARIYGLD